MEIKKLQNTFKRVEMLQKMFTVICETQIPAGRFIKCVFDLIKPMKVDVVTPAINELENKCNGKAYKLEYHIKCLQEYTEQIDYYVPSKLSNGEPLRATIHEAIAKSCGISEKKAEILFTFYIFIIDQRNEMAARLKSELERLKEWSEQDAEAARLEQETMRQERLKEQEPILSRLEQISSLMEANKPQDVKSAENESVGNYSDGLINLFNGHTQYIDKLIGLPVDAIAAKIKEWSNLSIDGKPICCNPANNKKSAYAKALKENNIISVSQGWFSRKL